MKELNLKKADYVTIYFDVTDHNDVFISRFKDIMSIRDLYDPVQEYVKKVLEMGYIFEEGDRMSFTIEHNSICYTLLVEWQYEPSISVSYTKKGESIINIDFNAINIVDFEDDEGTSIINSTEDLYAFYEKPDLGEYLLDLKKKD